MQILHENREKSAPIAIPLVPLGGWRGGCHKVTGEVGGRLGRLSTESMCEHSPVQSHSRLLSPVRARLVTFLALYGIAVQISPHRQTQKRHPIGCLLLLACVTDLDATRNERNIKARETPVFSRIFAFIATLPLRVFIISLNFACDRNRCHTLFMSFRCHYFSFRIPFNITSRSSILVAVT